VSTTPAQATDSGATTTPATGHIRFAANFQCTFQGIRLTGMLRMQEDSIIWLSISKIVELGRARLTPDSILVYARATQQYYKGDYASLHKVTGYRIDYGRLQPVFLDAYRERRRDVDIVVEHERRQDTLHLEFTHYTAVREQGYPLTIPYRARPLQR